MEQTVIQVNNLNFSYGTQRVLKNLDFYANRGEFVGVIGSNGSGKSTFVKLLLDELKSDSGEIYLFGQDIKKFKDFKRIGYVAQNSISLGNNFPATVLEIVKLGLYSKYGFLKFGKNAKQKAMQALELVGMQNYANRLITNLSGGQKQRVMLAKALAGDCDLLILDEPTTGIDRATSSEIYEILKQKCKEQNITVLMVTHDSERASKYCSRILCLGKGNFLELTKEQLELELKYHHKHADNGEDDGNI
ncbi:MAG TPA: metal ABC transporter ATP-binding protein [Clostridia bacterium]